MAFKLALLACLVLAGSSYAARPVKLGGSNPCAGQPDGAVVAAGGCSAQFYTCAGGAIVATQQCDSPLVFNPVANPAGCSQIGAVGTVGCNCAARYSGSMLTACQICEEKQKVGNYAFPGAPQSQYASCALDTPSVSNCPSGLVYCQAKDACLYPTDKC